MAALPNQLREVLNKKEQVHICVCVCICIYISG